MSTAKRSSLLPSGGDRRRFVVKRVSVVPPKDETDEEGQDDEEAVERPTFYERSLRRMTREALPQIDHYQNTMHVARPGLDELHSAVHYQKKEFERLKQ